MPYWHKVKSKKLKVKSVEADSLSPFTFAFLLLPFAFLLVSCAAWRAEPVHEATAEQLAGLLRLREAEIQSMKGLFRAQINGLGLPISQRVEGSVLFRRPSTYRLQGFDRMGAVLFDLTRGEEFYRLRLPATGRVYNGRLNDLDRAERMGTPLQLSLWAMSGLIGTEPVSKDESVVLMKDGDRYRLDVLGPGTGGATRRLWFDRRSLQVVREDRFSPSGDLVASIQFDDFRSIVSERHQSPVNEPMAGAHAADGMQMMKPFRITIQDGRGRGTLLLTFHEIVPNPNLDPADLGLDAGKVSLN